MSERRPCYHSERAIGPVNAGFLNSLTDAYSTCLDLAARGENIQRLDFAPGRPIITVAPSRRLRGEVIGRSNTTNIHEMAHGECLVRWEVRR